MSTGPTFDPTYPVSAIQHIKETTANTTTTNDKTFGELIVEYMALSHAMQTGVALDHGRGGSDGTPKHLRAGINSAHVSIDAVVNLLIVKGVFTREEYVQRLVESMRAEVERYEKIIGEGVKLA